LPASFDKLNSFEFTSKPARTREQSARADKVFGVDSFQKLGSAMRRLIDDSEPSS
jgi:hypothetical protein